MRRMHLIIGGAYQGKLAYARQVYGLTDGDVFFCDENSPAIDFSRAAIARLEAFVLASEAQGLDACAYFDARRALWLEKVILCEDIFCGVVPMDPLLRAWRESTGRLVNLLSAEALRVTRMFCGLPQALK